MLLTITITISLLVIINFLLLLFSSNKVIKKTNKIKKPIIFKLSPDLDLGNDKKSEETLAPTGS